MLDSLFAALDLAREHYGVDKVETVSEVYFAMCGPRGPGAGPSEKDAALAMTEVRHGACMRRGRKPTRPP